MVALFIDADACPVKDEALKVATRHGLKTYMVSDGGLRPSRDPMVQDVIVASGADAADDWIAENIQPADICVTNDIPLAQRELMQGLRETGAITGGPRPFNKADRSQFLNRLETTVQAAKRRS